MSKNCYPAIKNNIIQFLSDVKYENYDTELPNIEIFDNHFNNTYNYSENINMIFLKINILNLLIIQIKYLLYFF